MKTGENKYKWKTSTDKNINKSAGTKKVSMLSEKAVNEGQKKKIYIGCQGIKNEDE